MNCRICGNKENNKIYQVKEMMFGFRDKFDYFQCTKCNCLQISQIPDEISRYYPDDYYSFRSLPVLENNYIKYLFKVIRNNYLLFNKGFFGKMLFKTYRVEQSDFLKQALLIRQLNLNKKTRILDVGCGAGKLLYNLSISSLKKLLGIDPYIENNINYSKKLKILKNYI